MAPWLGLAALVAGGAAIGMAVSGSRAGRGRRAGVVGAGVLAAACAWAWWSRAARGSRPRTAVTQSLVSLNPADSPIGEPGHNLEERLDEAIQETYPASDPISVHIE